MPWFTAIECVVCKISDNAHPIIHDGPTPPEPGKDYAFRCPITARLQLVDPTRHVWTFTTGWICNPVRMEEHRSTTALLRFQDGSAY